MVDMSENKYLTTLAITTPRERSGPRTSNRFAFQRSWALCKMIDLMLKGESYIALFDFHDDIAILNSESDPTEVHFYQVKTKNSGSWTLKSLIKRDNKIGGSIIGKMVRNIEIASDWNAKATLVSNAGYKFFVSQPDSKNPKQIESENSCPIDWDIKDYSSFGVAAQIELNLPWSPTPLYPVYFKKDNLSLVDHEVHVLGILTNALEKEFGEGLYRTNALYRTMIEIIRKKNNYEGLLNSIDEMLLKKGIKGTEFYNMIGRAKVDDIEKRWERKIEHLQKEGVSYLDIRKYERERSRYETILMDNTDDFVLDLHHKAKDLSESILMSCEDNLLMSYIEKMIITLKSQCKLETSVYSDDFLTAVALMELE
jgi:hypothetical protein